jgi:hypothetical protein
VEKETSLWAFPMHPICVQILLTTRKPLAVRTLRWRNASDPPTCPYRLDSSSVFSGGHRWRHSTVDIHCRGRRGPVKVSNLLAATWTGGPCTSHATSLPPEHRRPETHGARPYFVSRGLAVCESEVGIASQPRAASEVFDIGQLRHGPLAGQRRASASASAPVGRSGTNSHKTHGTLRQAKRRRFASTQKDFSLLRLNPYPLSQPSSFTMLGSPLHVAGASPVRRSAPRRRGSLRHHQASRRAVLHVPLRRMSRAVDSDRPFWDSRRRIAVTVGALANHEPPKSRSGVKRIAISTSGSSPTIVAIGQGPNACTNPKHLLGRNMASASAVFRCGGCRPASYAWSARMRHGAFQMQPDARDEHNIQSIVDSRYGNGALLLLYHAPKRGDTGVLRKERLKD